MGGKTISVPRERAVRKLEKSKFCKMIDRICQLHPECENYHETKVALCEEFLETTRDMQGMELEPYLAEMKCMSKDGCFMIGFKIPLVPYSELRNLR